MGRKKKVVAEVTPEVQTEVVEVKRTKEEFRKPALKSPSMNEAKEAIIQNIIDNAKAIDPEFKVTRDNILNVAKLQGRKAPRLLAMMYFMPYVTVKEIFKNKELILS